MKRRQFNLGVSALAAAGAAPLAAHADALADKAALLKTTLTPFGSERAGNAAGTIPAWTGGATVPAGWSQEQVMTGDMFAAEKPYLTVNASNMAQYQGQLSAGIMQMMQQRGLRIDVYPSHRTHALPQYVYDNIAQNVLTAKTNPKGGRFGFTGGYGGVPFPIPDQDENQGVQIIWNFLCKWNLFSYTRTGSSFVVEAGVPALGAAFTVQEAFPYYDPNGSLESFDGVLRKTRLDYTGPPPLFGQELISIAFTNPLTNPSESWQLLPGQGRVRKAPNLEYDTPMPGSAGILDYDETQTFQGAPNRYNWKCVGKTEMFVPYNGNKLFSGTPEQLLQPHFVNPDYVRWERHRVWVLDATLAPGERNVVTHRRFYIDEDTWCALLVDEYDAQGNLWKVIVSYTELRPDLPGLFFSTSSLYDVQTNQYLYAGGQFSGSQYGSPLVNQLVPAQRFSPEDLAAQAQY